MNGDSYNITLAEGGFIVHVTKSSKQAGKELVLGGSYEPRVFTDSAALLNYLHNELVGSN